MLYFAHILQAGYKEFKQKPKAVSEQFSQKADAVLEGQRRGQSMLHAQGLGTAQRKCEVQPLHSLSCFNRYRVRIMILYLHVYWFTTSIHSI